MNSHFEIDAKRCRKEEGLGEPWSSISRFRNFSRHYEWSSPAQTQRREPRVWAMFLLTARPVQGKAKEINRSFDLATARSRTWPRIPHAIDIDSWYCGQRW